MPDPNPFLTCDAKSAASLGQKFTQRQRLTMNDVSSHRILSLENESVRKFQPKTWSVLKLSEVAKSSHKFLRTQRR